MERVREYAYGTTGWVTESGDTWTPSDGAKITSDETTHWEDSNGETIAEILSDGD